MTTCLIFDCDGVLVDSETISARVSAECFTNARMPITAHELSTRFAGISGDKVTALLAERYGVKPDPEMTTQRRHRIMAAFETELKAISGVERALSVLPQAKCVASSSHPERVAQSLSLTGLDRFFDDRVFSATMVAHGKPAPDLFLYAAAKLGRHASECLVIEDSTSGVTAAKAAGMLAIGFVGGSHCTSDRETHLRAAGADEVIASMDQLPALVADLVNPVA
jgi:HAD superfamily hydrolase (TIGR01509 family)